MIRHALHGHFGVFTWGAAYGGTQESTARRARIVDRRDEHARDQRCPDPLTAVTALLIWRVGRRTIGEPAAWVAGALFWVWPPRLLPLLLGPGFYVSDALLWCADPPPRPPREGAAGRATCRHLRARARTRVLADLADRSDHRRVCVMAHLARPAHSPLELARGPGRRCRSAAMADLESRASLGITPSRTPEQISVTSIAFASSSHRSSLRCSGCASSTRPPGSFPSSASVVYVGAVGLFLWSGYRARRRDAFLLYVVAGLFPFLYAASAKANLTTDPRYATVLVPCLALLIAQLGATYRQGGVAPRARRHRLGDRGTRRE